MCILRFIALFALYSEFCVRAFGEDGEGQWEYIAPAGLIGDNPRNQSFGTSCGAGLQRAWEWYDAGASLEG